MIDQVNRDSSGNGFEIIVSLENLIGLRVERSAKQSARRFPRFKRFIGGDNERIVGSFQRAYPGGQVCLSVKNTESRYQEGYLVAGDHSAILTKKCPSTPEPGDGLLSPQPYGVASKAYPPGAEGKGAFSKGEA